MQTNIEELKRLSPDKFDEQDVPEMDLTGEQIADLEARQPQWLRNFGAQRKHDR